MFKLTTKDGQRTFLQPGDRIVWYMIHDKIMMLRHNAPHNNLLFLTTDDSTDQLELKVCTKKDFVNMICLILAGNEFLDAHEIKDLPRHSAAEMTIFEITAAG